MVEIYGGESSGKSLLSLFLIREAQKLGRRQILKERAMKGVEFLRETRELLEVVLK